MNLINENNMNIKEKEKEKENMENFNINNFNNLNNSNNDINEINNNNIQGKKITHRPSWEKIENTENLAIDESEINIDKDNDKEKDRDNELFLNQEIKIRTKTEIEKYEVNKNEENNNNKNIKNYNIPNENNINNDDNNNKSPLSEINIFSNISNRFMNFFNTNNNNLTQKNNNNKNPISNNNNKNNLRGKVDSIKNNNSTNNNNNNIQIDINHNSNNNSNNLINFEKIFSDYSSLIKSINSLDQKKKIILEKAISREISSIIKEFIPHFANFNYEITDAIDLLVDFSTKFKLEKEKVNFYVTFLNSNFYTIKNKLPFISNKGFEISKQNSRKNKFKDFKIDLLLHTVNYLDIRSKMNILLVNKFMYTKNKKKIYLKVLKNAEKFNMLKINSRFKFWGNLLNVVTY
jgi:hypothetical protein